METTGKKPKSLIPRKAQIPMVLVGIPLLLYVLWSTSVQMGWVGGPPHAKPVQTAKQPAGGATGGATAAPTTGPTTAPTSSPSSATPPTHRRGGPATDLNTLRAPSRDPMAELGSQPAPPRPPNVPPPPEPATSKPATPPPAIPPPTAAPPAVGFPSPTTNVPPAIPPGATPMVTPAAALPHPLPSALGASYPMARRGTRAEAGSPSVTLMGTISGSRGSMAVVHPGEATRGQYVSPGQTVYGAGARVESIEGGKIKLGGRGGTREILLRPRPASTSAKSATEAAASTAESAPDVGGKPE